MYTRALTLLLASSALATPLLAAPTGAHIAVVYNGSNQDAGFNQLIFEGIRSFEQQRQLKLLVLDDRLEKVFKGSPLEESLSKAIPGGVDSIVLAGAVDFDQAVTELARLYPQIRMIAIDGTQEAGNVQTVSFRFPEASYLAGIVAARSTRSGTIGFVGGLNSAGIRAFGCAFAQGALAARADVRVLGRMIGNDNAAFSNLEGGRGMARELLADGADVVFAAAGGSGLGVLEVVAAAGVYGIGVDANQNGLFPGRILTSVQKRMDVAVYTSLVVLEDGTWEAGTQSVGLLEGAVGLAMDEHNRKLISRETRAELEAAEFAIRSGEVAIVDAQVDESPCAALISYPGVPVP
jgi:basic membrane protein A